MVVNPSMSLVLSPTDYSPPTPPPETGLHRYQFFVYLQGDRDISLSVEEKADLGETFQTFTLKLGEIVGQDQSCVS